MVKCCMTLLDVSVNISRMTSINMVQSIHFLPYNVLFTEYNWELQL